MSVLERRITYPNNCKPDFLHYARNITSQNGEDGIMERIFQLLSSKNINKFCVDVGAWDGKHWSNSYHMIYNNNWGGLLLEANGQRFAEMSTLYSHRKNDVICICTLVQIEGNDSLIEILHRYNVPKEFSFLTIDIDGADYHLWKSLHGYYSPMVVCIEFNPTIPNDIIFIQEPDTKIHQGSSLLALMELSKEMGYSLVCCTIFNGIFVRSDLLPHLMINNSNTIENDAILQNTSSNTSYRDVDDLSHLIHQYHLPTMSMEIFQTYDGEIQFIGPKKLLWHRKSIQKENLQILNKIERKYPFSPPWDVSLHELFQLLKNFYDTIQSPMEDDIQVINILWQKIKLNFINYMTIPFLFSIVMEHIHHMVRYLINKMTSPWSPTQIRNILYELNWTLYHRMIGILFKSKLKSTLITSTIPLGTVSWEEMNKILQIPINKLDYEINYNSGSIENALDLVETIYYVSNRCCKLSIISTMELHSDGDFGVIPFQYWTLQCGLVLCQLYRWQENYLRSDLYYDIVTDLLRVDRNVDDHWNSGWYENYQLLRSSVQKDMEKICTKNLQQFELMRESLKSFNY